MNLFLRNRLIKGLFVFIILTFSSLNAFQFPVVEIEGVGLYGRECEGMKVFLRYNFDASGSRIAFARSKNESWRLLEQIGGYSKYGLTILFEDCKFEFILFVSDENGRVSVFKYFLENKNGGKFQSFRYYIIGGNSTLVKVNFNCEDILKGIELCGFCEAWRFGYNCRVLPPGQWF